MLLKNKKKYLRTGDPTKKSEKKIKCLETERETISCSVHK
jgi:hypothetical protein